MLETFLRNSVTLRLLKLILGDIKHLEVPILVGITVIGGLWPFFVHCVHGETMGRWEMKSSKTHTD